MYTRLQNLIGHCIIKVKHKLFHFNQTGKTTLPILLRTSDEDRVEIFHVYKRPLKSYTLQMKTKTEENIEL